MTVCQYAQVLNGVAFSKLVTYHKVGYISSKNTTVITFIYLYDFFVIFNFNVILIEHPQMLDTASSILWNNSSLPRISFNNTKMTAVLQDGNEDALSYGEDLPLYIKIRFPMFGTKTFGSRKDNELFVPRETVAYLIRYMCNFIRLS